MNLLYEYEKMARCMSGDSRSCPWTRTETIATAKHASCLRILKHDRDVYLFGSVARTGKGHDIDYACFPKTRAAWTLSKTEVIKLKRLGYSVSLQKDFDIRTHYKLEKGGHNFDITMKSKDENLNRYKPMMKV